MGVTLQVESSHLLTPGRGTPDLHKGVNPTSPAPFTALSCKYFPQPHPQLCAAAREEARAPRGTPGAGWDLLCLRQAPRMSGSWPHGTHTSLWLHRNSHLLMACALSLIRCTPDPGRLLSHEGSHVKGRGGGKVPLGGGGSDPFPLPQAPHMIVHWEEGRGALVTHHPLLCPGPLPSHTLLASLGWKRAP